MPTTICFQTAFSLNLRHAEKALERDYYMTGTPTPSFPAQEVTLIFDQLKRPWTLASSMVYSSVGRHLTQLEPPCDIATGFTFVCDCSKTTNHGTL